MRVNGSTSTLRGYKLLRRERLKGQGRTRRFHRRNDSNTRSKRTRLLPARKERNKIGERKGRTREESYFREREREDITVSRESPGKKFSVLVLTVLGRLRRQRSSFRKDSR